MFNAKRGRLNQTFKSMAQQVRCPTCNRRFFDGFFVGVLEIICPRCGDPIIVTCEVPVSAAAGNGVAADTVVAVTVPENGHLPSEKRATPTRKELKEYERLNAVVYDDGYGELDGEP